MNASTGDSPAQIPGAARSTDYRVVLGFGPGRCLIVPRGMTLEVLLGLQAVPLPGAPQWWRGLVAVRGEILPVINLSSPWREATTQREQLVLLRGAQEAVVLITQGQPGFATQALAKPKEAALPDELAAHCGEALALDGVWESGWEWNAFAHIKALAQTTVQAI